MLVTITIGRQDVSCTLRSVCAVNFGTANTRSTSALVAARLETCESTVGDVTS